MNNMHAKLDALRDRLRRLDSVAVAFSGGVDSTFLLAVAHEVLGERALALTIRSPFITSEEIADATAFAEARGIPLTIIDVDVLAVEAVRKNPPDRCYICKRELFRTMLERARSEGRAALVEGSNVDDLGDYRPGRKAVKELGVHSPLVDSGLTKGEIRDLSREMNLPTWSKPALACLASRIPYGREIDRETLARIARSEEVLRERGLTQLRVRDHGEVARVEIAPAEMDRLLDADLREEIVAGLKAAGYAYVCLDLEGYRTGALNETLTSAQKSGESE